MQTNIMKKKLEAAYHRFQQRLLDKVRNEEVGRQTRLKKLFSSEMVWTRVENG